MALKKQVLIKGEYRIKAGQKAAYRIFQFVLRLKLYPFECEIHIIKHADDCRLKVSERLSSSLIHAESVFLLQLCQSFLEAAAFLGCL